MGVSLKGLFEPETFTIDDIKRKTIAVDGYNILYQFITTIRGYDGSALMNSKGQVTSHIQGLFARVSALLGKEIKLVFVFDGEPPQLKRQTLDERSKRKEDAKAKYELALAEKDTDKMSLYAKQTTVLTKEMVAQAKELLEAFGIPTLDAPSEGEAQAAHMCIKGHVDAVASQDADALLFGSPIVMRNVSFSGRRKLPGKQQWVNVEPQKIVLQKVLSELKITREQLITLAMLVGTDYAPKGISGIGPKNALKKVIEFGENKEALFQHVEWEKHHTVSWQEVYNLFINMRVTDDYQLQWKSPDTEKIFTLLTKEYEFSSERIKKTLETLEKSTKANAQKGLGDFL